MRSAPASMAASMDSSVERPQILTSTMAQLDQNFLCRCDGIRRACDGPANHQNISAGRSRRLWCCNALLVMGGVLGGTDAWNNGQESQARSGADAWQVMGTADD